MSFSKIIRFDDAAIRQQDGTEDKFAPIRLIWQMWSDLLPMFLNPSDCVIVDEQLCGFRGNCAFRQYMPSKPEKYGLQFWLLACAKTGYVWKIQPYLGKPARIAPDTNQRQRVVLELVGGLNGHNVILNKSFTSYELGQRLLLKQITMVGTIASNEPSIPPKLLMFKKAPLYQSTFAFTNSTALVSYVGKKNNCTLLQSTLHAVPVVETGEKKRPQILSYYKHAMRGINKLDKTIAEYSCKQNTNRWPNIVFSNMIDISALNAFIIYTE